MEFTSCFLIKIGGFRISSIKYILFSKYKFRIISFHLVEAKLVASENMNQPFLLAVCRITP